LENVQKEDKTVRFSVSLEKSLMDYIDKHCEEKSYGSRSEFIRDLVREKAVDEKWDEGKESFGVLTIIYDHHQRELNDKMNDLQHTNLLNIICNLHVHLNHHDCLETILLKGSPKQIERLANEIGALKGVKHKALTKTTTLDF
jgi:CopG family nickel-responsive transcriptional regulator